MLSLAQTSTNAQDGAVQTSHIDANLDGNFKDLDCSRYNKMNNEPKTPRKLTMRQPQFPQFPPTPESTPSRGSKKRTFSTALEPYPSTPSRKRGGQQQQKQQQQTCLTAFRPPLPSSSPKKTTSMYRCKLTPYFSILYEPEIETGPSVSAIELKRAAESVLGQVCWEAVGEDVASNRYGAFYRKVIRGILQDRLDQIYQQEEARLTEAEAEESEEVKLCGGRSKDQDPQDLEA